MVATDVFLRVRLARAVPRHLCCHTISASAHLWVICQIRCSSLCVQEVTASNSQSIIYSATLKWFSPSAEMVSQGVADVVHLHPLGATFES